MIIKLNKNSFIVRSFWKSVCPAASSISTVLY